MEDEVGRDRRPEVKPVSVSVYYTPPSDGALKGRDCQSESSSPHCSSLN